jgi:hypothetical protein
MQVDSNVGGFVIDLLGSDEDAAASPPCPCHPPPLAPPTEAAAQAYPLRASDRCAVVMTNRNAALQHRSSQASSNTICANRHAPDGRAAGSSLVWPSISRAMLKSTANAQDAGHGCSTMDEKHASAPCAPCPDGFIGVDNSGGTGSKSCAGSTVVLPSMSSGGPAAGLRAGHEFMGAKHASAPCAPSGGGGVEYTDGDRFSSILNGCVQSQGSGLCRPFEPPPLRPRAASDPVGMLQGLRGHSH